MSQAPVGRLSPEEEYRRIFEAASDGLLIYNVDMDSVMEANPAAVRCTATLVMNS